jgi:hypothetical protein
MNNKQIELAGVNKVGDFIIQSSRLMPHIDHNDKTDSWDGFIFVYNHEKQRKSDLIGRIPVQVKATQKSLFSDFASFSFEKSDLINYKNDGGIIFFLISITRGNIYYKSLLPYDLKEILSKTESSQKTKSIKLLKANINNIMEFECLCKEFIFHRKKQFSLPFTQDSPKKFKEILIHGVFPKNKNFIDFLVNKPQYLYGKTNPESLIFDGVRKVNIIEVKQSVSKPVFINNKKYFSKYLRTRNKDNLILQFGKNVCIKLKGNKLEVSIDFKGCLTDRLNESEFVLNFNKYGSISTNKAKILSLKHDIGENEIIHISKYNSFLQNTVALLKLFKIDSNEIDIDSMSDTDIMNLNGLINTFVLNQDFPNQNIKQGLIKIKISNITLLLAAVYKNKKIFVQDLNDFKIDDVYLKSANGNKDNDIEKIPVSIFILLKADDLISSSNIRLNDVIHDIRKFKHSVVFDTKVNQLVLEMIKAFDKSKVKSFLTSASSLLEWLKKGNVDIDVLKINRMQITKRQRSLRKPEIKLLEDLFYQSKNKYELLACIGILINDELKFRQNFEKLSDNQKKIFCDYPIYSLLGKK